MGHRQFRRGFKMEAVRLIQSGGSTRRWRRRWGGGMSAQNTPGAWLAGSHLSLLRGHAPTIHHSTCRCDQHQLAQGTGGSIFRNLARINLAGACNSVRGSRGKTLGVPTAGRDALQPPIMAHQTRRWRT